MKNEFNMIVCVAKDNLIGDKNPVGNGLLWHSKEELQYYKSLTVGNVVIFGENTGKVVPVEVLKKTRDVHILRMGDNIEDILSLYSNSDKKIFICGGATIYRYFLENYHLDKIYISRLKKHIEVKEAVIPLYFPVVEEYGYKKISEVEYDDFIGEIYSKAKL